MMWPDRRILDLLGVEHPIVLAPMASATNAELAAAVSSAGALGGFGAAGINPERLGEVVHEIRKRTPRPFNVNLFSPQTEGFDSGLRPGPGLMRRLEEYHAEMGLGEIPEPKGMYGPAGEQLEVLIERRVPVISFHFGVEPGLLEKARESGAKVLCSATTVAEARQLEEAGVDAIIAQGSEAGGHRGTFRGDYRQALIGTLALVPRIVDAVDLPVIAAGGVMDARGLVACLVLGASAVQMGTAFLACPEAPVSGAWRETLLRAEADDTVVTEAMSGRAARGIRNRYIREVEALEEPLLPYSAHYSLSGDLRKAAIEQGNTDFMAMWSGQGVGLIRQQPAAGLVAELAAQSRELMERFAGR